MLGLRHDKHFTPHGIPCRTVIRVTPEPRNLAALSSAGLPDISTAYDVLDAWLANRRLSAHTRQAYRTDVSHWLAWCTENGLDPQRATFIHINTYARALEQDRAPTTVARKLSAISSWYTFLVKVGAMPLNPVAAADRPYVDRDHSTTIGLSPAETAAVVNAADHSPHDARARVIITLLADLGLRVGELTSLDLAGLSYERGHRCIRFTGKGGHPRRRGLSPSSVRVLDAYLAQRAAASQLTPDALTGPLLITSSGARVDRAFIYRLVRQLARDAGITFWASLSPHSLRHAFATTARAEGVPLEDVQDAMGHADPRTTRRYDRDRHNLDRDPTYAVWAARSRSSSQ